MDTTKENALREQSVATYANTPKFYPTFSNAGQLQENGYQPIPIRPNQKSPSIDDWLNYQFSEGDPDRLGFQRHGIGILTARTPAIDIDCYCPIIAELLKQMVIAVLGCCEVPPPMRIGQKPKLLFLCQTKNPFRKKATKKYKLPGYEACKDSGVEILAAGQQFVAYGIYPDTRAPYSWNGSGDPLNVPVGLLTEITEEQAEEIISQAELIYEKNGGIPSDSVKPNGGSAAPPIVLPPETIAELRSALLFMRADDYDHWIDIAHALATLGDVGRGLWLEWGATAYQQWNAGEASKKWDSIKLGQNPDGTARTSYKAVFKKAQALGWTNPLKKDKAAAESRDPSGSAGAGQTPDNRNGNVVVRLQNGADIEPEVIRWLWDGWLAKGKLHIMAGVPGTGKTTIALAMAATISTGGRFPDGGKCESGNVLVWSGEDDPKDTLMPRLLAMGADRNRIYFVHDAAINGKPVPFDPAKHFSAIAEAVTSVGDVKLIIVDPIVSATSGDSHKTAEVRRSLQPVVDLAVKLDAAIVGISHFTKGTQGGDPLERVTGSGAFGALPRVVMATAKVKDNSDANGVTRRILVRTKSNIGPDGGGYEYSLDQQAVSGYPNLFASCVLWGEQLDGTAKQLLATAEADTDPDEQSEHKSAEDWLHGLLNETNGMQAGAVIKTAKTNGFSERTIYRAKNRLRLVVKITGFGKDRASVWSLPVTAPYN